jgi:hypothetical protein
VFDLNDPLPVYFELKASISVVKPTGGWKANAYMIFDYQSEEDFKFAGLDISTNKLVMGRRDASGWTVDQQASVQGGLKYGNYYNMLLAVNGTTVTLLLNNNTVFTYTYAPRVVEGVSYALNYGLVGLGSDRSRGQYDNVAVQVLPPAVTYESTSEFATSAAPVFGAATLGNWTVSAGRYTGSPDAGASAAISLADIGVPTLQSNSWLELSGKISTGTRAGFVFDRYADADFKFVALDVVADQVMIGHYTARNGYVIDASASRALNAGTQYQVTVTLKGSTASVSVDGAFAASKAFNALTVDGRFGVLARDGAASFDDIGLKTDDPAFREPPSGTALVAATVPLDDAVEAGILTLSELAPIVSAAKLLWIESGVLSAAQQADLQHLDVGVGALGGLLLGVTVGGQITVDIDGAGHGWFVDPTPLRNEEFLGRAPALAARPGSAADQRADLLTVVAHEIGHAVGIEHDQSVDEVLMDEVLGVGVRRLPERVSAAASEPALPVSSAVSAAPTPSVASASSQSQVREASTGTAGFPIASRIFAEPPTTSVPVIAFGVRSISGALPANSGGESDLPQRGSAANFVNNLGRSPAERNPNVNLRVTLPTATQVAPSLSSLSR